jgi:hypothetical protein
MKSIYHKVKRLTKINSKAQIVRGIITPEGTLLDDEDIERVIASNYQKLMGEPLFLRSD